MQIFQYKITCYTITSIKGIKFNSLLCVTFPFNVTHHCWTCEVRIPGRSSKCKFRRRAHQNYQEAPSESSSENLAATT